MFWRKIARRFVDKGHSRTGYSVKGRVSFAIRFRILQRAFTRTFIRKQPCGTDPFGASFSLPTAPNMGSEAPRLPVMIHKVRSRRLMWDDAVVTFVPGHWIQ